jgi:protein involved in polysaccharide export with SLBB domain
MFRLRRLVARPHGGGAPAVALVGLIVLAMACASPPTTVPSSAGTPTQGKGSADSSISTSTSSTPASTSTRTSTRAAYRLGTGDQLRIIVFGEEDLSGEFQVDDTGAVSIPLVGDVTARGQTLRSFEAAVREKLTEGYLKDPRVSVQVLNYRPFYIIGEVENDGEYPFVSGMHVLNAVAVSGGFTYRANTSKVFITRGDEEHEYKVTPELRLEPGDVIRVPERFF